MLTLTITLKCVIIMGRKKKFDSETKVVGIRLPISFLTKKPKNINVSDWLTNIIMGNYKDIENIINRNLENNNNNVNENIDEFDEKGYNILTDLFIEFNSIVSESKNITPKKWNDIADRYGAFEHFSEDDE